MPFCRNYCIELCLLQGRGGVAVRLPDLGGVQRAATSYVLPSFTGKGTTPRHLCNYCTIVSDSMAYFHFDIV